MITAATTTLDRPIGTFSRSHPCMVDAPAITNSSLKLKSFRMSEDFTITISFEAKEPDWLVGWMKRLSMALNLPEDWDSYGASRVKSTAALGAVAFVLQNIEPGIPVPTILPHRSGGVQLDWHVGDAELEVLVFSDHRYRVSYLKDGMDVIDDVITEDPVIAINALKDITNPQN
jgi:hypothetical protein